MKKIWLSFLLAAVMLLAPVALIGCEGGENGGTKLAITPSELEMEQYEEATLSVNKEGAVTWSSSDPMVVRVSDGVITSVKMGNAVITAQVGEETATCDVTVIRATKSRSLILSDEEVSLHLGVDGEDSKTVTAELKESGSTLQNVNYVWASSDPAVAEVRNGNITAVASGNTVITVSTTYKGQAFAKEIAVSVRDWAHDDGGMALLESASTSELASYDGDVTALGFEEGTQVTQFTVNDGATALWNNRVLAEGATDSAGNHLYTRMIFDLALSEPLTGDMVFWIYDKVYTYHEGTIPALDLDFGVIVYDKATGEVFTGKMETGKVYTFVVKLNQPSEDNKSWGLSFAQDTVVYFANTVCCNEDYYQDQFGGLDQPSEPFTDVYFVYGDSLEVLVGPNEEGWFEQTFAANDLWAKRVYLGTKEWTTINHYIAMKERYDYYCFDIIFKDNIAGAIWTGGYALMIGADGTFTKETVGGAIEKGDIYVYDESGSDVTGQPLQANTVYSFKVKIQKEADGVYQNLSTGIGLNQGTIWLKEPYFMKQENVDPGEETPDPEPEPEPEPGDGEKVALGGMVCGDSQAALTETQREGYEGWFEQTFDSSADLWGKRVYGFDSDHSFIAMREYAYYGFDIVFVDNFADAFIWTGAGGMITVADGKFNAAAGDLFVYDAEGNDVTGETLQTGVAYTLKIKLYGVDSNEMGLGLNGAGTLLVKSPYLTNK